MARTIQSPGVEINEVDLTLRAVANEGTNVYITGFSNQGPIDEVLQPTSVSEFEQIYGLPTNEAERYFYHSVKNVLNSSPANVYVSRLPYGENKGDGFSNWRYSALVYPVLAKNLFIKELSSYSVDTFVVTNSGKGYAEFPKIIASNGLGTAITAVTADDGLSNGTCGVVSVNVINMGTFETKPVFSIDTSYIVSEILISSGGIGYLAAPKISFSGSTFTEELSAEVTDMVDDGIGSFSFNTGTYTLVVTNSGSGLTSAPILSADASSLTPAIFVADLANDHTGTGTFGVSSVTVTYGGDGYRGDINIPIVVKGGGTNPSKVFPVISNMSGTVTPTYSITEITIKRYGKGYNTKPNISLDLNSVFGENAELVVNGNFFNVQIDTVGVQSFSDQAFNKLNTNEPNPALQGYEYSHYLDNDNPSLRYLGKTCYIGKPTHLELSLEEYQSLQDGSINWSNYPTVTGENFTFDTIGNAGIIILNESQTTVNNKYEGYYVGLIDNSNYNPATPFNGILNLNGIQESTISTNQYIDISKNRLSFSLSATNLGTGNTISEVMENLTNYELSDNSYNDVLSLGIFKLRKSVFTKDVLTLDYSLTESYVGSIDYSREIGDSNGGAKKEYSIEKISRNSNNIHMLINPFLSDKNGTSVSDSKGNPAKRIRLLTSQLKEVLNNKGFVETNIDYAIRTGGTQASIEELYNKLGACDALFPLGIYQNNVSTNKNIGTLPSKIERAFELIENSDVFPIDIALEAGLGTIFVNAMEQSPSGSTSAIEYDDSVPLHSLSAFYVTSPELLDDNGTRIRSNYNAIANIFVNYAEKERKDFLAILDPLKNIFVQGENSKIITSKKILSPFAGIEPNPLNDGFVLPNFSQHIYWPLRHQFGTINCSYATTYANWAQVYDSFSGRQVWVPFSGIAASIMANTDSNFQPWYAPAGFTRGIVTGANDLAIYPKQKQRDQLYKISINPVAFFPNEGFTVFGQKTLLKRPSAFDRINVRRLFLSLEKATKNTAKFFVFEPNTLFTRTQVINVLSPIFENAKNTEGLYDYRIICDERNNTPDVIDNNELKIDIYIQPVRTAEFILVNFYATRTGTNFDELIGG